MLLPNLLFLYSLWLIFFKDNNVERAIDYLFSHPDEMEEEKEPEIPKKVENLDTVKPQYLLHGAIVHLGKSVHCGHYVSYLRHNGKWVLFNDRKVAETEEPLIGKSYLLLFRRVNDQ